MFLQFPKAAPSPTRSARIKSVNDTDLIGTFLSSAHRLVICGPVYGELYGRAPNLDDLLEAAGVDIEPDLTLAGWRRAGQAHAAYTARRQASRGGLPRRTLTDMLIGAHASTNNHALLTLNIADYGDFPEVSFFTVNL